MITVVDLDEAGEDPFAEYDPYTPVTLTWPAYSRSLEAPVSLGLNGPGGYLELKFGKEDRRLVELVLVSGVVSVRDARLPVAAFDVPESEAAVELSEEEGSQRALTGELLFSQIAYTDALEIRLSDQPPTTIAAGPVVGFGALADGELAAIYVKYDAEERATLLEGCSTAD